MSRYSVGLDMLGAGRSISVDVKDPQAVAKSQGAVASIATTLLPDTIASKVYEEMAKQIGAGLRDKGIDADVRVVSGPIGAAPRTSGETRAFFIGGALGFVVGIAGKFIWRWFKGRK